MGNPRMFSVVHHRYKSFAISGACVFLLLVISCKVATVSKKPEKKQQVIAFFGSSVCRGSGDEQKLGYAGRFGKRLDSLRWKYVNVSIGGDNTIRLGGRMHKDLYPQHPDFVVIGLSLSNEGIVQPTEEARYRILERFRSGILRIADSVRTMGAVPVFTNCYPHNSFKEEYYRITRSMNAIINEWPVASINLLGTVDDGSGKWVKGLEYNGGHPNGAGYEAMSRAFSPTLFEALAAKKPAPFRNWTSDYTRFFDIKNTSPVLQISTDTLIRSFSQSLMVKVAGEGVIAAIQHRAGTAAIKIVRGKIVYESGNTHTDLPVPSATEGQWIYLTLSHRHASGETYLYVNGQESAPLKEKIEPHTFLLGGYRGNKTAVPDTLSVKDWMIHRSALFSGEAKDYMRWKMLRSSLEVYAPLTDSLQKGGSETANLAQSLSRVFFGEDAHFQVVRLGMQKQL